METPLNSESNQQGTDAIREPMGPLPPVRSIDLVLKAWALAVNFSQLRATEIPPESHRKQLSIIAELLTPIVNAYKAGHLQ